MQRVNCNEIMSIEKFCVAYAKYALSVHSLTSYNLVMHPLSQRQQKLGRNCAKSRVHLRKKLHLSVHARGPSFLSDVHISLLCYLVSRECFCGTRFSPLPLHLLSVMAQEVSEADFSDAHLNYQSTVGFLDSSMKVYIIRVIWYHTYGHVCMMNYSLGSAQQYDGSSISFSSAYQVSGAVRATAVRGPQDRPEPRTTFHYMTKSTIYVHSRDKAYTVIINILPSAVSSQK